MTAVIPSTNAVAVLVPLANGTAKPHSGAPDFALAFGALPPPPNDRQPAAQLIETAAGEPVTDETAAPADGEAAPIHQYDDAHRRQPQHVTHVAAPDMTGQSKPPTPDDSGVPYEIGMTAVPVEQVGKDFLEGSKRPVEPLATRPMRTRSAQFPGLSAPSAQPVGNTAVQSRTSDESEADSLDQTVRMLGHGKGVAPSSRSSEVSLASGLAHQTRESPKQPIKGETGDRAIPDRKTTFVTLSTPSGSEATSQKQAHASKGAHAFLRAEALNIPTPSPPQATPFAAQNDKATGRLQLHEAPLADEQKQTPVPPRVSAHSMPDHPEPGDGRGVRAPIVPGLEAEPRLPPTSATSDPLRRAPDGINASPQSQVATAQVRRENGQPFRSYGTDETREVSAPFPSTPGEIPSDRPAVVSGASVPDATLRTGPGVHPVLRQLAEVLPRATDGGIEITLNPEELGKVRMSFVTGDAGSVLHVTADRPETLELVRRHIDLLTQEFRAQGFARVDVSLGNDRSAQGHGARALLNTGDTTDTPAEVPVPERPSQRLSDGLDIRL